MASYLSDRIMMIRSSGGQVAKKVTRGCPQGSILGPDLWVIYMDPLLKRLEAAGGEVLAYADNLLLRVPGTSQLDVEHRGQALTNVVCE